MTNTRTEAARRAALGVPDSATEVVVVAESTHWDPNWLLRAEQYYRLCVRPTLDRAIAALVAEPRRVFSLECLFFVDRYWRDRPEVNERFRALVNQGRLRFTGCGVTTPDTLLPEDEVLLRDLLLGQEWLRARGMDQEPRLLYLPDSFGHSPGLPALLRAAGIDRAAVCRIDGMRFPGADLEPADRFPRPGSSAAHLLDAGTADFVWRAPDGSEVLSHWMAHGYGHGDMVASGGVSRVMGLPASWPDRRPHRVDARIDGYLADLRSVARTPYRLLTIGFDFVRPVPDLVGLLDGWNERHHDRTGVWLVNAAIDDYLDLVDAHRDVLPTLDLDPNPYWTGFYASRPDIKATARDLGRRLVAGDAARSVASAPGPARDPRAAPNAWWTATTANHHDFVTGTAPDRVALGEQAAWLRAAVADSPWPTPPDSVASDGLGERPPGRLAVVREGDRVVVSAPWGAATFDPARGGALVSLTDGAGDELLGGPSLVLASYAESGGLWRLGHEIHGGRWSLVDESERTPGVVTVDVADDGTTAQVAVRAMVDGRPVQLRHTLDATSSDIVTRTVVTAARRRTVTLLVRQGHPTATITMHQPGAVVDRPLARWYDPTFWPLHSFAVTNPIDRAGDHVPALAVGTATPTGLHVRPDGTAEVIVARTPLKELAFGVVPVMAPAWGWRRGTQEATVALGWHRPEGADDRNTPIATGRRLVVAADRHAGRHRPMWPVVVDDPHIEVVAAKPADRGTGTIIRLRNWTQPLVPRSVRVALAHPGREALVGARLADSRERDGRDLPVAPDGVEVPVAAHLTTVRLLVEARGKA